MYLTGQRYHPPTSATHTCRGALWCIIIPEHRATTAPSGSHHLLTALRLTLITNPRHLDSSILIFPPTRRDAHKHTFFPNDSVTLPFPVWKMSQSTYTVRSKSLKPLWCGPRHTLDARYTFVADRQWHKITEIEYWCDAGTQIVRPGLCF